MIRVRRIVLLLAGSLVALSLTGPAHALDQVHNTAAPVIIAPHEGNVRAGENLGVYSSGEWDQELNGYDYQWQVDGQPIPGVDATGSSFLVRTQDVGHVMTLFVTAKKDGYESGTAVSNGITVDAAELKVQSTPTISPTAATKLKLGTKVALTHGHYTNGGGQDVPLTYTYAWAGKAKSRTKSSYTLVAGDAGRLLSVTETAHSTDSGDGSATSNVVMVPAFVTKAPVITGTAVAGKTLKATRGTWYGVKYSYTYQWLRAGKVIKGATKTSYRLGAKDKGKKISVRVTAKRTGWATVSSTSKAKSVKK